ncbi:hypothetical protein Ddye_008059 [Dipteronia dyeriana]|uniref:Reverse transcriptase n=1 Tax=Dipteronia dyeriana TaxID=168575 RepID=A0AAD9X933_9ROSI|nr:hypothetical protein Ddye_008059 [Dipteronia dyeriana]
MNTLGETVVVLIPKVRLPVKVTEFRFISLYNVVFKVLAKMLGNRLKVVLDKVISQHQSAFVPGRIITDNVVIGFECLHYLRNKRDGKKGYIALKLDMSKAYDRVERKCLTSLISNVEASGNVHGIKAARGAPSISHLLFANDILIFARAVVEELSCHDKYLSLPSSIGRNKRQVFEDIKDRKPLATWGTLIEHENCWVRVGEMLTMFENSGKVESSYKVDKVMTKVWSLPSYGCFKLNTDAVIDLEKDSFGVGIVIMEDKGALVLAAAFSWVWRVSVKVVEAKAILEGMLFTKDLGLFPLCVESYALGIVGLCNRTWTSLSDVNNVITDILALKSKCIDISFVHIPRSCNKVAYAIARYSVVNRCSSVWSNIFLDWLSVLAISDVNSCSIDTVQ